MGRGVRFFTVAFRRGVLNGLAHLSLRLLVVCASEEHPAALTGTAVLRAVIFRKSEELLVVRAASATAPRILPLPPVIDDLQ